MKSITKLSFAMMTSAAVLLINSASATIAVTPGNMNGWGFYHTDTSVTYGAGDATGTLVSGSATPPLGTGSANLNTGSDGFQSSQLRNNDWAGTALSSITTLSYSTYVTSWNGQQATFLNLYLDNGDRLWFEPAYSAAGAGNGNPNPQDLPALNTWQTWDALNGMWYSDIIGGPGDQALTWAAILALETPGVAIASTDMGGIRIASGFASSGDVFNTYVDNFSIGNSDGTTTYDFEPGRSSAVPEPTTFIAGALLLLPFWVISDPILS